MDAIFNALSVLSFILSAAAIYFAARAATVVQELRDLAARFPASALQSLRDSQADQAQALADIANRVKMIKVRNAANHVRDDRPKDAMPDPHRDPEGWRKAMNERIMRARVGLPQT